MTDKERYATIGTWVEVFRKEGVSLDRGTIRTYLNRAGVFGITARNKVGRVLRECFYRESDVRNLCSDLLAPLPESGEDGFIRMDGETYGTIIRLSELLGISQPTIQSRIQQNPPPAIRGKDLGGRVRDFYSLSGVKTLCSDLLTSLPAAGEDGLIRMDGETYGPIGTLCGLLGISEKAIRLRMRKNPPQFIQGKDQSRRVQDFYALSDIRSLCADLLQTLPQAGDDGLIHKDGETYGTIESYSRLLSISALAIQSRIRKNPPQSIQGKDQSSHVCDFYALSDIRSLCADLLQTLPRAGEDDLIHRDGEIYGTIWGFISLLGLSQKVIESRIRQNPPQSFRGKGKKGQLRDFYALSDIRRLCSELLEPLPQADEAGFIQKDGETYGTINSLSRLLGISGDSIQVRIRQKPFQFIRGKDQGGRVQNFYALSEIKNLCADLITKRKKA